jgi:hypothetical protein
MVSLATTLHLSIHKKPKIKIIFFQINFDAKGYIYLKKTLLIDFLYDCCCLIEGNITIREKTQKIAPSIRSKN